MLAIMTVYFGGEKFTYTRGHMRIYGKTSGAQVNAWDHENNKPAIEFTPEAILARLEEWKTEGAPQYPPPRRESGKVSDSGNVYRSDGLGCVERVHPSELAWEERYG